MNGAGPGAQAKTVNRLAHDTPSDLQYIKIRISTLQLFQLLNQIFVQILTSYLNNPSLAIMRTESHEPTSFNIYQSPH
ncbi:hypothetical protein D3C81_1502570 [compost metagenome]